MDHSFFSLQSILKNVSFSVNIAVINMKMKYLIILTHSLKNSTNLHKKRTLQLINSS